MELPENVFIRNQFFVNSGFELKHHKNTEALNIEWHSHEFYEIYIFLSGSVIYNIENAKYKLSSGDILIINPQVDHRAITKAGDVYQRIVLFIRPEFILSRRNDSVDLSLCFKMGSHKKFHPNQLSMNEILNVIIKIYRVMNSDLFGAKLLVDLYMTELLVLLNQSVVRLNNVNGEAKVNESIDKITHYINENIRNDLSLDSIAKTFHKNKHFLCHSFKKYTGTSVHKFISFQRLLKAASLLESGVSVTMACEECGYGDYNNFIRAFKKMYGVTPKKFVNLKPDNTAISPTSPTKD